MRLNRIELTDYRNISHMVMEPCEEINVIYGDNAQGKTNLLEAIWLFSGNQSFRGSKVNELVRFDQNAAKLSILFEGEQRTQKAEFLLGTKKKLTLNGVELKSLNELTGSFCCVVFSPADLSFIKDGPKYRRRFLDIAISQIKPQYKSYLTLYEKLVEQRNALLRNADRYRDLEQNIEVWDLQLAKAGTILSIYRNDYVKKLQKVSSSIYEGLCSKREKFEISYSSTVYDDIHEVEQYDEKYVEKFYLRLKDSFQSDLKQGFTSIGIHRDDLDIFINGCSARTYGSQGQQRSGVIALKLAEAKLLRLTVGEEPVMLLDDVMSELDEKRQDYILNHLMGMQVFLTCCDLSNMNRLKKGRVFHIANGCISLCQNRADE